MDVIFCVSGQVNRKIKNVPLFSKKIKKFSVLTQIEKISIYNSTFVKKVTINFYEGAFFHNLDEKMLMSKNYE